MVNSTQPIGGHGSTGPGQLVNIFDAFYTRFVLRDFFGKIIPGLILLCVVVGSIVELETLAAQATSLSFWVWVFVLGIAWITAFAIQSLGEFLKLIRYYKVTVSESQWTDLTRAFREHPNYYSHQQRYERLVVIKEACGNSYVALMLSGVWLFVHRVVQDGTQAISDLVGNVDLVILIVLLILLLRRMHFVHVNRQHNLLESVLGKIDET